MSHTVRLSNVVIKDLDLLEKCIAEVLAANNRDSKEAYLDRNAKEFRNEPRLNKVCSHVIRLPKCAYDIGLVARENAEGYLMEFSGMLYGSPVGYDAFELQKIGQQLRGHMPMHFSFESAASVGKLSTEYVLCEAEIAAAQQGMHTNRVKADNGLVCLEIYGN
jgi:hypothetical protein